MFRHDESFENPQPYETHHVLSFLCGGAGMLGFSALNGSRKPGKLQVRLSEFGSQNPELIRATGRILALFASPLALPPSDGGSHIRANQEKIIANAEDAEAERGLPVSQNGRSSG